MLFKSILYKRRAQINYENIINELKKSINQVLLDTKKVLNFNITRGHTRSISSDIEDHTAIFISKILKQKFNLYLDPSIKTEDKTHRPDLLIVNEAQEVVAMIELKANMGYCRDASEVIDKMLQVDKLFSNEKELVCKFSGTNDERKVVKYSKNVKLFLISFTEDNCSLKNHAKNKKYANANNISHFNLFSGWYDNLVEKDIDDFIIELVKL